MVFVPTSAAAEPAPPALDALPLVVIAPDLIACGVEAMLAPHIRAGTIRTLPVGSTTPHLVLLDVDRSEPAADLELLVKEMLTDNPGTRVVAFTWNRSLGGADDESIPGVTAYIDKGVTADQLGAALQAIHRDKPLPPGTCSQRPRRSSQRRQRAVDALSERELQIVRCIGSGSSNQEVADQLYLSINTVKSYIRAAYRKMKVETRAQAVLWAVDNGLQEPRPGS